MATAKPTALSTRQAAQRIEERLSAEGYNISGYDLLCDVVRSDPARRRGCSQIPYAKRAGRRYFKPFDVEYVAFWALKRARTAAKDVPLDGLVFAYHETKAEREAKFEKLM